MARPVWTPNFEIFLDTMQDLRCRSGLRASEYDVLQISGLVRRLLLDKHPLLSQANRKMEMPIRYTTGVYAVPASFDGGTREYYGPFLDRHVYFAFDDITALYGRQPQVVQAGGGLPLDDFLQKWVVRDTYDDDATRNGAVTVHELVTWYAHKLGGVHLEPSAEPTNALLAALLAEEPWRTYLRDSMSAIGRVVYEALEPLATAYTLSVRKDGFGFPLPMKDQDPVFNPPYGGWRNQQRH